MLKTGVYTWNPNDLCFCWKFGLVLGVWPAKIGSLGFQVTSDGLPERQFAFDKIKLVGTGCVFCFCFFDFKTLAGFSGVFCLRFLFHIFPVCFTRRFFFFWRDKLVFRHRSGQVVMLFSFRENLSSVRRKLLVLYGALFSTPFHLMAS